VAPLTVSVTADESGRYTLVELAGEADVTVIETLRAVLEAQTRKRKPLLIIEMSGLMFIDSAALQVVLRANLAVGKYGGRLALVNPGETVARVLEMTQADQLVPVYGSVAQAAATVLG
jgi:anti-anti-sigma factor